MPFKKGQSGNPAGRPAGASSRLTRFAQAFLQENQEDIVKEGWERAKEGDSQLYKIFLERVLPPAPKELKVDIELEMKQIQSCGTEEFSHELMSLQLATWDTDKLGRFIKILQGFHKVYSMSQRERLEYLKEINRESHQQDRLDASPDLS